MICYRLFLPMQRHLQLFYNRKIDNVIQSLENIFYPVSLTGTAALRISILNKKKLYKPWILTPVSSKSVVKWGNYGHLKNSIWPTLSRHFEYLISFQNFYNCLILSSFYYHIVWISADIQLCT